MAKRKRKYVSVADQVTEFSQYKRLFCEVQHDRRRLAELQARTSLCTAPAGLPDLFGADGQALEDYRARIDENLMRCMQMIADLQCYINAIADSEIRCLFVWRYLYGYSWQRVATAMGVGDESVPRKKHNRYLAAHPYRLFMAGRAVSADRFREIDEALRREAPEIVL